MNAEKKVFSRLFKVEEKVELSINKIELGLVDDFLKKESLLKEYHGIMADFQKAQNTYFNYGKLLKGGIKKDIGFALNFVDKIKTSSKDLGVDVPKKVISLEKDFKQALTEINRVKTK